ncbi:pectinesterase inhibitor 10-like [Brachypodium distachyon]|uniref:pectinesterase inhibitor 10-like n=1 Tax=Brachypodium distachyon TaxID=15368 RepID=UPI00071DAA08|nr:pectinesterase inhibitor 10-like [Brachypodium distachyon]|eukprot:XP_014758037.1 pectinesterase inhibitor 10-like [Brachypodium distachyon]
MAGSFLELLSRAPSSPRPRAPSFLLCAGAALHRACPRLYLRRNLAGPSSSGLLCLHFLPVLAPVPPPSTWPRRLAPGRAAPCRAPPLADPPELPLALAPRASPFPELLSLPSHPPPCSSCCCSTLPAPTGAAPERLPRETRELFRRATSTSPSPCSSSTVLRSSKPKLVFGSYNDDYACVLLPGFLLNSGQLSTPEVPAEQVSR